MKKIKVVLVMMVLLLVLGSVGYATKKQAPKTTIDELVQIMDGVIVILKKHSKNPEAAAIALTRYMKINDKKMARINKVIAKESEAIKKDPSKLNAFMMRFAPLVQKSMEIQQLSMQLMTNKHFMKAMNEFRVKSSRK